MKRILLQLALLLLIGFSAQAQTHTVTGKVVDEHGQSLPGVEVAASGAGAATETDANGDWLLEVPDGVMAFYVQAAGYNAKSIEDSSQFILIQLAAASKSQDGNIVTALGAVRDRNEVGYNAQTLNSADINDGGNVSVISALAGKVTGADISSTGGYGGTSSIVLRGAKSFLQDNNALIVVDGVPINNMQRTASFLGISNIYNQVSFGNGANDINPEDVESVTILEGAAAATLYGSAGANGAVMITTKSAKTGGKSKKMEVTYKMAYSQTEVLKVPDVQHIYGQGDVYSGLSDYRATNYSWGTPFDNVLRPWGQIINGKQLVKPYSDQATNINDFFNYGNALNNYASVKGGGEKTTYFLSLDAVNSTGVIPNNYTNRYSARFNGSAELSNNFYSQLNVNVMNSQTRAEYEGDGGTTGNAGVMENLLNIPRDIPVNELSNLTNPFYSMNFIDTSGARKYGYFSSKYANPYWSAQDFSNINTSNRVTGDLKFGYKHFGIDIFDRIGVDINSDNAAFQTPQYLVTAADQSSIYPGTSYVGTSYTSNGGYAQAQYNGSRIYNDLIGNYKNSLTNDIGLDATVGTSLSMSHDAVLNSVINPLTSGLVIPNYYNFSNTAGPISSSNLTYDNNIFGIFGDFRFNYRHEYFLELTGRTDWSSTFNYSEPHFYPGANLSWLFTERLNSRIKDKWLNYGKIRFGAAGAGTGAVPYANNNAGFAQLPISTANGSVVTPFNTIPAYQIQNTFGDQSLRPELTREYEVGTDLAFLRDRITFSFTYYNSYTYNLIAAVPTAPSSGFAYNYANVGDVTNKGEEIAFRAAPISTKWGFRWELFGNYMHNVNDVVSLSNNQSYVTLGSADGMQTVAAVGHALGTFYGSDIAYWQNPKDGSWHAIVDPNTGLPVATTKGVFKGSYQPKFVASWGTTFNWAGLKLNVIFATKQGGQYFSNNKMLEDVNGTAQETTINNRNALVWANSVNQIGSTNNFVTNTTKYLPYDYFVNEIGGKVLPAQGLVDASYIKLQEISLTYRIPRKYYNKSPFGALEAGLYGNNLFIWTPKSNHYDDPEVATAGFTGNNLGINYSAAPSVKNYGFMVKVTF